MNKFSQIAKKQTTLSAVMEGRDKISTKTIKETYPGGITITEFDFITASDPKKGESTFPVFAFAEDPHACFFGGEVLNRIAQEWANAYGGDVEAASADLKKSGGVKVRLSSKEGKMGNSYTAVEVLDD